MVTDKDPPIMQLLIYLLKVLANLKVDSVASLRILLKNTLLQTSLIFFVYLNLFNDTVDHFQNWCLWHLLMVVILRDVERKVGYRF